jgi:hypothetical protein
LESVFLTDEARALLRVNFIKNPTTITKERLQNLKSLRPPYTNDKWQT